MQGRRMQENRLRLPAIPLPYAALFPQSAHALEAAQAFTLACIGTGGQTI